MGNSRTNKAHGSGSQTVFYHLATCYGLQGYLEGEC